MKMANAYCKKHDEIEPENHDFYTDGLWICPKCSRENLRKTSTKLIEGMKPVDYAVKKVLEKYPELCNNKTGGNDGR